MVWQRSKYRKRNTTFFKAFNFLGGVIYSLGAENVLKRKFCIEIWKYQIIIVSLQQIFFFVIILVGYAHREVGVSFLAERFANIK